MITPGRAVAPESREHKKYEHLIISTEDLQPLVTAVAHPCDETSLKGALEAASAGLIVPILVGPRDRICAMSEALAVDLHGMDISDRESGTSPLAVSRQGKERR